jgi:type VI secretion system secreted protein VgrG
MGLGFAFPLAVVFLQLKAGAQEVNLGTANDFAVLAGSAITVAGAANTTSINGNIGSYPTPTITGLGNLVLNGLNETGDAGLMLQAQNDLSAAYTQAAGLAPTGILTGTGLGNLTLTPGVYFFASSAQLTGQLTLNDEGNPDAVFVFQIGSTLTTASSSSVVTINDPTPSTAGMSVFWQVTSVVSLK